MRDAVVIGAGLAGLAATLKLAHEGASVTLVTRGIGGLQLGQGTIDVLGYSPERLDNPLNGIAAHVENHPHHPYQHFTAHEVAQAVQWLADEVGPRYLQGHAGRNVLLPTAVGSLRPTALYQPSMAAAIKGDRPIAVVGLRRLKDFPATLIAQNLSKQTRPDGYPMQARAVWLDHEIRPGEMDTSALNHARYLDTHDGRVAFAAAVRQRLRPGEMVALPGILGVNDPKAWRHVQDLIGHDIFEIPTQPPSVPGMRLNQALVAEAKKHARLIMGASVIGHHVGADGALASVTISSAGRARTIEAANFVVAAGGFESGALELDSYVTVRDTVLDLPVHTPPGPPFHGDFWGADQPLFLSGLDVDRDMRVLGFDGEPVYPNVYAAGGNLRGAMRWREKSGEGIALASALRAAESILGRTS